MQMRCQTIFLWAAKNDLFILNLHWLCMLSCSPAELSLSALDLADKRQGHCKLRTLRAVCTRGGDGRVVAANRAMELACLMHVAKAMHCRQESAY